MQHAALSSITFGPKVEKGTDLRAQDKRFLNAIFAMQKIKFSRGEGGGRGEGEDAQALERGKQKSPPHPPLTSYHRRWLIWYTYH